MALHPDAKLDHLRAVRLFRNCSHKQLEHVASIVDEIDVEAGRVLCKQGESGHEAFVIVSGEASVVSDGVTFDNVGPGTLVGEISLIDHGPRMATVTAATPMQLMVVPGNRFAQLLEEVPGLPVVIMRDLASILRSHNHH
ncbi:MAG: cyclic nucleotide-binding domain-containing protein [Acidimicrobiales bacterium]